MARPQGAAEGDGGQNRRWRRHAQFGVWSCPQRVIDGGEGQAECHEGRDGEDLHLVEARLAQILDVSGLDGVRVGGYGPSPLGQRPLFSV